MERRKNRDDGLKNQIVIGGFEGLDQGVVGKGWVVRMGIRRSEKGGKVGVSDGSKAFGEGSDVRTSSKGGGEVFDFIGEGIEARVPGVEELLEIEVGGKVVGVEAGCVFIEGHREIREAGCFEGDPGFIGDPAEEAEEGGGDVGLPWGEVGSGVEERCSKGHELLMDEDQGLGCSVQVPADKQSMLRVELTGGFANEHRFGEGGEEGGLRGGGGLLFAEGRDDPDFEEETEAFVGERVSPGGAHGRLGDS